MWCCWMILCSWQSSAFSTGTIPLIWAWITLNVSVDNQRMHKPYLSLHEHGEAMKVTLEMIADKEKMNQFQFIKGKRRAHKLNSESVQHSHFWSAWPPPLEKLTPPRGHFLGHVFRIWGVNGGKGANFSSN